MGRIASAGPPESIEAAKSLAVGDRIRFRGEKQARFKVRARGPRFVILTKPFNARQTCIYTVIDVEQGIRGTDNYGGLGYDTSGEIAEAIDLFNRGEARVSVRNNISLDIRDIKRAKPQEHSDLYRKALEQIATGRGSGLTATENLAVCRNIAEKALGPVLGPRVEVNQGAEAA
jgi:hypothetical protein